MKTGITPLLMTGLIAMVLPSCGATPADEGSLGRALIETKKESYTYEFELNGCNTGRHQFLSKNAMCEGLKSQSLNNYCAVSMRERHFERHACPGNFETER